jgi:hypothetical protein
MNISSSTSPLGQAGWSRPAVHAHQGERAGGKLKGLDGDNNGSISAQEFGLDNASEAVKTMFKAIDTDGSGELSQDEVQQFREQLKAAAQANPQTMTDPGARRDAQGVAPGEHGPKDPRQFLDKLAARYAQLTTPSALPPEVNITA